LESASQRVSDGETCVLITSDKNMKLRARAGDFKVSSLSYEEAISFLYNTDRATGIAEHLNSRPHTPSDWVERLRVRHEAAGREQAANRLPDRWCVERVVGRRDHYFFHWNSSPMQPEADIQVCFDPSGAHLVEGQGRPQYTLPREPPPLNWHLWHNGHMSLALTARFAVTPAGGGPLRPSLCHLMGLDHHNRLEIVQVNEDNLVCSHETNWQWKKIRDIPLLMAELNPSDSTVLLSPLGSERGSQRGTPFDSVGQGSAQGASSSTPTR